jgi:hypothetical protein
MRGGRYFIVGKWPLEWLRAGEVSRKQGSQVIEQKEP